jgi:eukaryotic-like serine/threonine-protein kinase
MDAERWQRVAALYESVIDRPPDERAVFLAAQCAGDNELRREIESLLEQDDTPVLVDRPMLETAAAVLDDPFDLKPGTQLGPYRIADLLGAGGMGQVYRATDTRLNRTVAIKVLPKAFAADPQFRSRFDREAHVIASLTHPHICTLHDVGRYEGVDFLVMEYLDGDTLSARLRKGPLPFDQAMALAIEIAEALTAAHRVGIVHRDLKPGNIILTRTGAKLLDFGLAKPPSGVAGEASLAATTESSQVTAEGAIVGTLQYMAPEQLEGANADARTDIFAFGAILYEMLTGRRAFEGKSQAGLIAAIMRSDPPAITAEQPLTPPALDRIVKTCLAKDPDDRWQSARDLARELRWVRRNPGVVGAGTKAGWMPWAAAALLAIAVAAVMVWRLTGPAMTPQATRFRIDPPPGMSLPPASQAYSPSISPDGRRLVFQIVHDRQPLLAVRSLDALESQVLLGTEGGRWPFWSPDSRDVAFFVNGKLKKINAAGGPVQTICDVPSGWGGTWNRDGLIVFLRSEIEGFYQVPAAGGVPIAVLSQKNGERFNGRPHFLPDGRRFLFGVSPDEVHVASLVDGSSRRVLKGTPAAVYARTGHLIFYQGTTLVAQRFDADLARPLEEPVPLGEGISGPSVGAGGMAFSASETGVVAYKTITNNNVPDSLGWLDRSGRLLERLGPFPFERFGIVTLSPDGTHLAMQTGRGPDPQSDIWIFDLARRLPTQLTFADGTDRAMVWSPDGQQVAFTSLRAEAPGIYSKAVRGERPEELLLPSKDRIWEEHWPTDWSSKGILFESGVDRQMINLWMLPLEGDRRPYPVLVEPGVQMDAKISPSGNWVAYTQRERDGSIRTEVFLQSLLTKGAKRKVSTAGGRGPHWRRDGKELFYIALDGSLIAVPIEGDETSLQLGVPQTLFPTGLLRGGAGQFFGVSADGQRFLLRLGDDREDVASIVVLSNWPALLHEGPERR